MKKGVLLILLLIVTVAQVNAYEFCDNGIIGEDNLRIISVDDMLKDNNKEWKWEPLQNIELEIRVENKDDKAKDYTVEVIFIKNDNKVNLVKDRDNLEKEFQLSAGERKSISLEFQIEDDADVDDYELYVKFYKNSDEDEECTENSEEQITIEKVELCENGNVDRNDLEITRITDERQSNNKEWKWTPGKEIEISVDISNKDYSERNFIIELIMLDEDNNEIEFAKDNTEITDEENLDEDEDKTIEFNFELSPNLEEGKYNFYAKMYDEENENICTALKAEEISNYKQIEIKKDENNVIVSSITGPKEIQANTEVTYTATITNLGSEDEEKVLIMVYNRILNLRKTIEIENLESGQEKEVKINFSLPENSSTGEYKLLFSTEFKYDNKRNIYRGFSNDNDDIKYPIELLEVVEIIYEEPIGNETIGETNDTVGNGTIFEDIIEEDEGINVNSPITGNVVGGSDETSIWPIIIGLLFVAIIGLFLFFKKPKIKHVEYTEQPIVNRRYTARLD